MSFHRRLLPEIEKMKEIHLGCETDEEFVQKIRGNSDSHQGSLESFEYLRAVEETIKQKTKTND
jgi:hypothetical protein